MLTCGSSVGTQRQNRFARGRREGGRTLAGAHERDEGLGYGNKELAFAWLAKLAHLAHFPPWSLEKHQELSPSGVPVCWWISSSFGGFHAVASVPDGGDRRGTRPHSARDCRPITSLLSGSLGSFGIRVEPQSSRESLRAASDSRSAS